LVDTFRQKFNIPKDYEIIFTTMSGTGTMEAFISHFTESMSVEAGDFTKEKFARRWKDIASYYSKYDAASQNVLKVQYETAISLYNGPIGSNVVCTDAISSFPYFETPNSPAWVTVSSKMLGAAPVVGIMVIKRDWLENRMKKDSQSYLNPYLYFRYQNNHQTPFTPAMPLFSDLLQTLQSFNIDENRQKINKHYEILVEALGLESFVNPSPSPVLTLKDGVIKTELAKRWDLYGANTQGPIQIFLYSGSTEQYQKLADEIRKK